MTAIFSIMLMASSALSATIAFSAIYVSKDRPLEPEWEPLARKWGWLFQSIALIFAFAAGYIQ